MPCDGVSTMSSTSPRGTSARGASPRGASARATSAASRVRLVRRAATPVPVPGLDAAQQAVVDHRDGPLLVLAGPGTGKTTTLVEAVVDCIQNRGADPSEVLVLTFSRKAAGQLRDRVTARLGRTVASPLAMTFHSFAYAVLRRFTPPDLYTSPLRLLTASQADVLMQEVLSEHRAELGWPKELGEAVNTRGFSREVEEVVSRAREKGADDEGLLQLGAAHREVPGLLPAGRFLSRYLDSLDDHGATDYADLVRRAVIEAQEHREELRRDFRYVFVDEYQDTDPGQVALLRALAGDGHHLVVAGDPHQSIYGFRGAEVRGILDFPRDFRTAEDQPAPVVVLGTSRRLGRTLLDAAARITANISLGGVVPGQARERLVRPVPHEGVPDGRVEVFTYDTERAEADRIADLLRRAHHDDGVAWSDMAVLVRTEGTTLPVMRRLLSAAGVPVEVAADAVPLGQEVAVEPLLNALELVSRQVDRDEAEEKAARGETLAEHEQEALAWIPTVETAEQLLLSPLGGLGATPLRALARALRRWGVATAALAKRPAASSGELVARSLVTPGLLEAVDADVAAPALALRALFDQVRAAMRAGESVESLLWRLWSGTSWGENLRAAVMRGGLGAHRAHRDLDALCALFEASAKAEGQRGQTSPRAFVQEIRAEQIPADSLADKGVRGDAVHLLTAHRSKGMEWKLVVVAHVQEDNWPDLKRRVTLLGAERIGARRYGELEVVGPVPRSVLVSEERRLFHVACTRAQERLVVTAVHSAGDDGEVPSRFVEELCTSPEQERTMAPVRPVHLVGRPERPLSLTGVVADLRRTVADPEVPEPLREAAARRLARLAAEEMDGRALVPTADPRQWWGTAGHTRAAAPVREEDAPVKLSASTVQSIAECPAKWFLEREAGGATFSGQGAAFGNVVHKIAEHVTAAEVVPDVDELMQLLDQVWDQLPFRTPWSKEQERAEARAAIERFVNQHTSGTRKVLGTEVPFSFTSTLPDGSQVHLRGFADRLEVDGQGRVVVVDLKTGKNPPTDKSLVENPQLGIYQYAVEHGGFEGVVEPWALSGGAELWQLRASTKPVPKVQAQAKQDPDEEGWVLAERQMARTVETIRSERFLATPGKHCDYCAFSVLCPAVSTTGVIS